MIIANSYDIKDIEAHRFLEAFEGNIQDQIGEYNNNSGVPLPELAVIDFPTL